MEGVGALSSYVSVFEVAAADDVLNSVASSNQLIVRGFVVQVALGGVAVNVIN